MDNSVKKMIAVLAPLAFILSACTTTDMATTNTTTTTQQVGTAALKIAINYHFHTDTHPLL
jgi:starvation-inducible outer membrane lipoprotein